MYKFFKKKCWNLGKLRVHAKCRGISRNHLVVQIQWQPSVSLQLLLIHADSFQQHLRDFFTLSSSQKFLLNKSRSLIFFFHSSLNIHCFSYIYFKITSSWRIFRDSFPTSYRAICRWHWNVISKHRDRQMKGCYYRPLQLKSEIELLTI